MAKGHAIYTGEASCDNGDNGMPTSRRTIGWGLLGLAALRPGAAGAANREPAAGTSGQRVRVLSTTDQSTVQPLIDAFEKRHAGLRVDYRQLGSMELIESFLADGGSSADVLWSSAMGLQIKLVNDGHAQAYESPHAARLPRWAVWKYEAYGTTYEPVGIVYHRPSLAPAELPRTHEALTTLLRNDVARFRGRVSTYDIERAGLGFLIAAYDALATPASWELVKALGRCQASLHADTRSMLEEVAAGRSLLAYNVLGAYAESFARGHPQLGVAYLVDYTLVASRVAFIARRAPNVPGARAWLDHLLSPQGQQWLEDAGGFYGVRTDAAPPRAQPGLGRRLGDAARPIALGPGLMAHLDRSTHEALLKRWRREFRHSP
jgi:iron(III) transport system substrate-binding protein